MNILDLVVGKPIKTSDERAERIGPAQGIPIFGLDGLSSAAYGPEAALSLLIPLGLLGVRYIVPISAAIITLLVIVYFSYRQHRCLSLRGRFLYRGALQSWKYVRRRPALGFGGESISSGRRRESKLCECSLWTRRCARRTPPGDR